MLATILVPRPTAFSQFFKIFLFNFVFKIILQRIATPQVAYILLNVAIFACIPKQILMGQVMSKLRWKKKNWPARISARARSSFSNLIGQAERTSQMIGWNLENLKAPSPCYAYTLAKSIALILEQSLACFVQYFYFEKYLHITLFQKQLETELKISQLEFLQASIYTKTAIWSGTRSCTNYCIF